MSFFQQNHNALKTAESKSDTKTAKYRVFAENTSSCHPRSKLFKSSVPSGQARWGLSNFTLTELLVVVGIMGMLLYVAMPAFSKMVKGSGVAYSATTIMGRIGLARGAAISKNRYVALLMPEYNSQNSGSGSRFPNKYLYSSTRMCYVRKSGSDYTFVSWVPNDVWEFLPPGTVIFRANNVQEFNPQTPSTDNPYDLGEGTAGTDYSVVQNVNCSDIQSSGMDDMDNVRAIIFKPTGQTTFNGSLYVKIGEGAYTTGELPTITNRNNYRNIEIDQFVGRINVIN